MYGNTNRSIVLDRYKYSSATATGKFELLAKTPGNSNPQPSQIRTRSTKSLLPPKGTNLSTMNTLWRTKTWSLDVERDRTTYSIDNAKKPLDI